MGGRRVCQKQRCCGAGFRRKLSRLATQLPFAEELAAAWFCATDPATPAKAKGIQVAALSAKAKILFVSKTRG